MNETDMNALCEGVLTKVSRIKALTLGGYNAPEIARYLRVPLNSVICVVQMGCDPRTIKRAP